MDPKNETIGEARRTYLPAAGHDWFLPLYDPLVKLMGGDRARRDLVDQAAIRPASRVLEVGCGTGSLLVLVKSVHPDVEVVGLDPDPKALARAKRKADGAGISMALDRGFSDALPYPRGSFDVVLSSLMFHHLAADEKQSTLREIHRVLKPGGAFHMLDLAGPESRGGFLSRLIHSDHVLEDNSAGRIVARMSEAGFSDAKLVARRSMLFTRIAYYRALAPA
ncbi:MAG: class I SAM-dependent methyltransferase [Candidatus Binatia bacterium]